MICRKLFKWTVIPVVGALGAGYLVFGSGITSYATTAFGDIRKVVRGSVPVDFELRRARNLIAKIDPEILEARREVATAEVELTALDKQIADLRTTMDRTERKMQRHKGYLSGQGEAVPVFHDNRDYGMTAVKGELCRTFDMYRNQVELLKSKESLRARQVQVLEASRTKLVTVRAEKDKLEDLARMLEQRKRQLDAMAAATTKTELDTSSLREAKSLLADIQKRLDVSQKIIQEELFLSTGSVASPSDPDRDIVKEIESFFGDKQAPAFDKLERVKATVR